MADTFETAAREPGGAKSTILRLIRPSANTSNPETAALRAGVQVADMTALRQLKAAWERFAADEANLTEFLNAKGKRR